MSFSNFETKTEYIKGSKTCVYCGNQNLVIDDSFDEYGNYNGTRNYCECEKAKLEQSMKREMELYENKKKELEKAYEDKLRYNTKVIEKAKLEGALSELLSKHVMYGDLYGMKKEEFLELAGEMFDQQVWEDDFEDDFEDE